MATPTSFTGRRISATCGGSDGLLVATASGGRKRCSQRIFPVPSPGLASSLGAAGGTTAWPSAVLIPAVLPAIRPRPKPCGIHTFVRTQAHCRQDDRPQKQRSRLLTRRSREEVEGHGERVLRDWSEASHAAHTLRGPPVALACFLRVKILLLPNQQHDLAPGCRAAGNDSHRVVPLHCFPTCAPCWAQAPNAYQGSRKPAVALPSPASAIRRAAP